MKRRDRNLCECLLLSTMWWNWPMSCRYCYPGLKDSFKNQVTLGVPFYRVHQLRAQVDVKLEPRSDFWALPLHHQDAVQFVWILTLFLVLKLQLPTSINLNFMNLEFVSRSLLCLILEKKRSDYFQGGSILLSKEFAVCTQGHEF